MSENTTAENILFRETENLDDSELQFKLYEKIYYELHDAEVTTASHLETIQFDNMPNKVSSEQDDTQATTSISKLPESTSIVRSPDQETNPVIQSHVKTNNDRYSGNVSTAERKKNNKHSSQDHKSLNCTDEPSDNSETYSKYNVLQKQEKKKLAKMKADKEMGDSSDSDISIFEVPVPPKPKPLLINLQDSDEDDNLNSERRKTDTVKTEQKNAKTVTRTPGNIVLNCSPIQIQVQTGASSINEIRQSSRSAEMKKDSENKSSKTKNQNSNKNSPYDKTTKNNINRRLTLEENSLVMKQTQLNTDKNNSEYNNLRLANQDQLCNTSMEESCTNSSPTTSRKRHQLVSMNDGSPKDKRQCSNQHIVLPQDNGNQVVRKELWHDYFFKPMTDEMRTYYNSTKCHEYFDVVDLQRNMSNNPRKWKILDEDLMPRPLSKKQHTRFWNVRCGNCRENGHQRYDCAAPRKAVNCYICGERGHNESRCPKKSCLTCGKKQNTFRQTCENCRILCCTMCNSIGHLRKHCPDLWRRYHQTTSMSDVPRDPGDVMKPPSQLYCCNCAKCGHESSTCTEYRWSHHFPTPASVTNYTCGPRYRLDDTLSVSNSGQQFAEEANPVSLPTETENRLVSYDSTDIQRSEFSASFVSSANKLTSHRQEATFLPEQEGTLAVSSTVHDMGNKPSTPKKIDFYHVIYFYRKLHNKNNEEIHVKVKNLSVIARAKQTSVYAKETINSLAKGEVIPTFFKTLTDKRVELEVTIGFKTEENNDLMLQILATPKTVLWIYNLFNHWIHLPKDERDYGIDVTLPTNLTKMYNLLNGRRMQVEKLKFKSYKELVETHSQNLLHLIKYEKMQLMQHNGSKKEYRRLRTKLWRLQTRLLMIVNTEPEANKYICKYYEALSKLKKLRHKVDRELDNCLFLKYTVIYNNLFVPHTPVNAKQMIDRIMKEAKEMSKTSEQQVTNVSPTQQQILNNQTVEPFYADVSLPAESSTFHMPQENFIVSSSVINAQQTASDVSLPRDDINVLSNTNDLGNHTSDDEVVITYASDQIENAQPAVSKTPMKKRQKKNEKKKKNKKIVLKKSDSVKISNLIKKARAFKLPYMLQAADKLEKNKNNGMLKQKHINTLTKLIGLEKTHRKNVISYCKSLD